jgi:hypothetical protein
VAGVALTSNVQNRWRALHAKGFGPIGTCDFLKDVRGCWARERRNQGCACFCACLAAMLSDFEGGLTEDLVEYLFDEVLCELCTAAC